MNMTESEYHAYPAWSHSLIYKYIKNGFSAIATMHDPVKPTDSMEFGSMFDCMVTKGRRAFEAEYVVMDRVPAPAEKVVLDQMAKCGLKMEDIGDDTLLSFANGSGYRMDLKKDETKIKKLRAESEYYNAKVSGKSIVSSKDYSDGLEMIKALRDNELTSSIFGHGNKDGVEFLYQAQFLVTVDLDGEKADYKIMPDLLIIDHNSRTIQPVDLKTSANPAYGFKENFIKFRYDIQAHSYSDVIGMVKEDTEEKDYEILDYLFVDISRTDKVPVVFSYPQTRMKSLEFFGRNGLVRYKDWRTLLGEMVRYEKSGAKVPDFITLDKPNDIISLIECRPNDEEDDNDLPFDE